MRAPITKPTEPKVEEEPIRVGIFGGTFAPVHNGHIEAAKRFMEQMRLDYLFVIPTGIPPHKETASDHQAMHRLRMCELAFANMDGVIVSDMEIRRGGISYTVDTVRELNAPGRRLLLLCGTDKVLNFDRWRDYREILSLCYPVYIRRENDRLLDEPIIQKLSKYYSESGKMFRKLIGDPVCLSSGEIRARIAHGEDISSLVPPLVESYIRQNGLYRELE